MLFRRIVPRPAGVTQVTEEELKAFLSAVNEYKRARRTRAAAGASLQTAKDKFAAADAAFTAASDALDKKIEALRESP